MKFNSRKDLLFSVIIFGFGAFLIATSIVGIITLRSTQYPFWTLIPIFVVIGLLFWMYFGTNYELSKENEFIYRSGPFNGKIEIEKITEIVKGKTLWVGFRPATARNGLIVKYDKFEEIYISPKTNESFVEKILEFNKNIKITEG